MPNQRGYNPDWFWKGFTWDKNENEEVIPICFICGEKKSTSFLREEMISKHFESHKKKRANTDKDTMEKLYNAWLTPKTLTAYRIGPETDKSKLASIIMSKHIARCKLPHTIAEDFLIPCMLDIMNVLSPGKVVQMVEDIPKSNNTAQRRMIVWRKYIASELSSEISRSPYPISLQLDESTDIAHVRQLVCWVRFVDLVTMKIREELMFCEPLENGGKAVELVRIAGERLRDLGFPWSKVGSLCCDGANVMKGDVGGFYGLAKLKNPEITFTHCMLHRHALAAKTLPEDLNNVLNTVALCVRFIRRVHQGDIFRRFCEEVDAKYHYLLYHSDTRWLSKGPAVKRFYLLIDEISAFLESYNFAARDKLVGLFKPRLAYLCDIFEELNTISESLQGNHVTRVDAFIIISVFVQKMRYYKEVLEVEKSLRLFPTLEKYCVRPHIIPNIDDVMRAEVIDHLDILITSLNGWFPAKHFDFPSWIIDPFSFDVAQLPVTSEFKAELMMLKPNIALKLVFDKVKREKLNPCEFWIHLHESHPHIAEEAIRVTLPFVTSYLCEQFFSHLVKLKPKQRFNLDVRNDAIVSAYTREVEYIKVLEFMRKMRLN